MCPNYVSYFQHRRRQQSCKRNGMLDFQVPRRTKPRRCRQRARSAQQHLWSPVPGNFSRFARDDDCEGWSSTNQVIEHAPGNGQQGCTECEQPFQRRQSSPRTPIGHRSCASGSKRQSNRPRTVGEGVGNELDFRESRLGEQRLNAKSARQRDMGPCQTATTGNPAASQHGSRRRRLNAAPAGCSTRRVGQSGPFCQRQNRRGHQRPAKSTHHPKAAAAHRETATTGNPAASQHGSRRRRLNAAPAGCSTRRVGQSGPFCQRQNRRGHQRPAKSTHHPKAAAAHRETATTGNPAASQHGSRRRRLNAAPAGWRRCSGGPPLRDQRCRLGGDGRVRRGAGRFAVGPL